MGNFIKSTDNMPSYFSYDETKDRANHLNTLFKQNQFMMKIGLQLNPNQLKYNDLNWKQSVMPGTMYVVNDHEEDKKQFKVIMTIRKLYAVYENMKHFQKRMEEERKLQPSVITPDDSNECCICMEKAPTMMLPCSHEYCDKCTLVHIIETDEKKCPKCRRQFKCGRESLQKQIYTVIQEDGLYDDLRKIVLDSLSQLNERQVTNIRKRINDSKNMKQQ